MSEENNVTISSTEKDANIESETGPMEEHNPSTALHSDKSTSVESRDAPVEQDIQEHKQPTEPVPNREQNISLDLRNQSDVEVADSSPSEQRPLATSEQRPLATSEQRPLATSEQRPLATSEQRPLATSEQRPLATSEQRPLATSDAPSETNSLDMANDIVQSAIESTEISAAMVPSSDKALQEVTDNIQTIYEGIKDMKLNEQEVVSASGKKGRKPAATPRARSTPISILTSPPVTRSRSRDLRKFPSTPVSPARVAARKGSESDTEEIKGVRGRQRAKKNN